MVMWTMKHLKSTSFQYLYGRIPQQVIDTNPFFSRVNKYIGKIWGKFKTQQFIESDIYNKRIYKKIFHES